MDNAHAHAHGDIEKFLARFHEGETVDEVFVGGCCYWFAVILLARFSAQEDADLMYDEVLNHFGAQLFGRVWDITGDVTDDYDWKRWSDVDDKLLRERVIRDCMNF